MKNIFLFVLMLFCSISAFAQTTATVSGRIYDNGTGNPLPFATITLNADNKIVAGAISGDDGRFVISGVAEGEYMVKCSFIGYQTSEIPLLAGELNKNFDLG